MAAMRSTLYAVDIDGEIDFVIVSLDIVEEHREGNELIITVEPRIERA